MENKVTLAAHRGRYSLSVRITPENGAIGFTCEHPDICGEILDRIGARKLR